MDAFEVIRSDERLAQLATQIAKGDTPVAAAGVWGSFAPILAAFVAARLGRPLLIVTGHPDEADDFRDDIEFAIGRAPMLLPQLEAMVTDAEQDAELAAERLRLCVALLEDPQTRARKRGVDAEITAPPLIVASILALMQPVSSPESVLESSMALEMGNSLEPDRLVAWLDEHRFERCDAVEQLGDYARRGGIIDIFCAGYEQPVRIEFFGDQIESIRFVEPGTQRSTQALGAVRIPAMHETREAGEAGRSADGEKGSTEQRISAGRERAGRRDATSSDSTTGFFAYVPPDAIVAFSEPQEAQELGRTYWQRLGERAGLITADAILRRANDFSQLWLQRFDPGTANAVHFEVGSLPQFEAKTDDARRALHELSEQGDVVVLCDNAAEEQRFREWVEEGGREGVKTRKRSGDDGAVETEGRESRGNARPTTVRTLVGSLHRGFRWRETAFISHHELFRRQRQRRTLRRIAAARPIDSFFDLSAGDLVVHVQHGIARFRGLKTLDRDGQTNEYLALEFADNAVVHVPASQIHLVQKYIGNFRGRATLSKLGGTTWKRTKERVAEAMTDLAGELLVIQAERAMKEGIAYPHDTHWQREFEDSFLYTETEDQLRALAELKADMNRPRPMDRLLCGDVGFGKTELAIRAAFKVVEFGKQVAVLVPTTVLAEQHHQTFRDRMADYPFVIEVISRFRTKKEQAAIVDRVKRGQIDILIGTHRLLSPDVKFADLGLVVIDEEQRFGVQAKERLKRLRATVDVLTLSATPIPRTLHMALLGIRDISSLQTPPLDRRAIVTQVRMWDDNLIRDAITRELSRDGQVYFVHNFVRDVHAIAAKVRELAPDARVVVGHGQMSPHELEEVMLTFLRREADVLVSTTIIESGIDIPSANTIFINRAERFGLAELHQLRGRVGRSSHRAYSYLLLSPKHPVNEKAAKRLKAVEHFSDLGAGFQIAMRDLEIRGAGNILGPEQSGHIDAVGYEMYCELLEQATRRLRNEPVEPFRPVNLELGVAGALPRTYIRADRQRMDVYKRLTLCRTPAEVASLSAELRDAFGPLPEGVRILLLLAEIRALARRWGIRSIVLEPPDVIFAIEDLQRVQALFSSGPGSPRMPDSKTVHWRLPKRLLEREPLLETLRVQLSLAENTVTAQSGVLRA